MVADVFEPWLQRWALVADGAPLITPGSRLLPVRLGDTPAMLKIALDIDEKHGNQLMAWWEGNGAAQVLALHEDGLLMERAMGRRSLMQMALNGQDDEASRILCTVLARLHAVRDKPPPPLVELGPWFASLRCAAAVHGGSYALSLQTAEALLAAPQEVVLLHGDMHHDNVLDFGARDWLAIDPKRVRGERGFDYANLLCNPALPTASNPERFRRQVEVIVEAAQLDRHRLLQWVLAFAGLSAAWFLEDDLQDQASGQLKVAQIATSMLDA
ncbi:streptomycin 6-kinase [Pseudomonas baetica]|uniref:Streptomycin 6-kinase n=1 Tax=Pseudomonas baetica TaxID=674054 RepID=A0ABX4Q688_9PSED|nr:aminoglycoside phosphotransferase family protein [Pseudomonas baetica]MDR9862223.1 aminoglycoside phosphotransferase family protein [Pseudomonas baetica]PKA72306.1 streptomycin 6-kinase [Pseudomonas baetica]PTC17238.1 3'-kinase [Pseudomonas baetica]